MGADQLQNWARLAASATDWWRDAGVDTAIAEVPRDWRRAAAAPPMPDRPAALPDSIADFAAWRTGADAPERAWRDTLIGAEGNPAAPHAVVIEAPGDTELIDGAEARLLDRMLAAVGLTRASMYLVPLAVARPIAGRIPPESADELATLLRHQLALAGTKRALALGAAASRALIGMDTPAARGSLHAVNLQEATMETVASWPLRFLLDQPARKADAWRDLQLWMRGMR